MRFLSGLLILVTAGWFGCAASPPCTGRLCHTQPPIDRAMYVKPELVSREPMALPSLGKWTVIDFWEVPCGPCIEMMLGWEALWQRMKKSEAVMVGVSLDNDVDTVRDALQDGTVSVSFPMLYDGKARALDAIYQIGIERPVTIVLDRKGRVVFDSRGFGGNVLTAVNEILKKRELLR